MKKIEKALKQLNCSKEYIEGFLNFHKAGIETEQFQKEILQVSKRDFLDGIKGMKVMYDMYRTSQYAQEHGTEEEKKVMGGMIVNMMNSIQR